MPEIAEQIFDMPVRRGTPVGHRRAGGRGGEPGLLDRGGPRALRATATARGRGLGAVRPAATGTFGKVTGRLMGWLSDFF